MFHVASAGEEGKDGRQTPADQLQDASVVIVTYDLLSMLLYGRGEKKDTTGAVDERKMFNSFAKALKRIPSFVNRLLAQHWALLVLDEVHRLPATTYRNIPIHLWTDCVLGLTATLLREDKNIGDLLHLVGPVLAPGQGRAYLEQRVC